MNAPRPIVPVAEILDDPAGDRLWLALARVLRGLEHLDARQAAEPAKTTEPPSRPQRAERPARSDPPPPRQPRTLGSHANARAFGGGRR